jgi:hypothetical protein
MSNERVRKAGELSPNTLTARVTTRMIRAAISNL